MSHLRMFDRKPTVLRIFAYRNAATLVFLSGCGLVSTTILLAEVVTN